MRATRNLTGATALVAVLLLAGCGSSGIGDILGGGGDSSSSLSAVRGTVDRVDASGKYIVLTNTDTASYLNNGGTGSTVAVYYGNDTVVEYQGRTYRPEDLERGDRIEARVEENNNRLYTDRIAVLSDVSGGGTTAGGYGTDMTGTVSYVDSRNRVIEIDRGTYGSRSDIVSVLYDTNTVVTYQGQRYQPEDLERGDVVDLDVSALSGGRYRADAIRVTRSVSDAGYGSGTNAANVVRGAVRYVDTRNLTLELEQASWRSGFAPGDGGYGSSSVVVVRYGSNTPVEYQGRTYSVQNLERGDVVDVRVTNTTASTPVAERIVVVSDARGF